MNSYASLQLVSTLNGCTLRLYILLSSVFHFWKHLLIFISLNRTFSWLDLCLYSWISSSIDFYYWFLHTRNLTSCAILSVVLTRDTPSQFFPSVGIHQVSMLHLWVKTQFESGLLALGTKESVSMSWVVMATSSTLVSSILPIHLCWSLAVIR